MVLIAYVIILFEMPKKLLTSNFHKVVLSSKFTVYI